MHNGNVRVPQLPGTLEKSRPVHPTQLYSAVKATLLCLFLLAYYPFRTRDGEVLAEGVTLLMNRGRL